MHRHPRAGRRGAHPTPCFVSYQPEVTLAGGVPVEVPCRFEAGFQPDLDGLRAALTPKRTPSSSTARATRPARSIPGRAERHRRDRQAERPDRDFR